MQTIESELTDLGYQIVAISADRPSKLQDSRSGLELGYQLFSDSSMTAAAEFGIAWQLPQSLVDKYLGWGLDLEGSSGQSHKILPVPAVFIVDRDGIVQFRYVNPKHSIRLKADILLAAAKSFSSASKE